jgi:hypothetical protein
VDPWYEDVGHAGELGERGLARGSVADDAEALDGERVRLPHHDRVRERGEREGVGERERAAT